MLGLGLGLNVAARSGASEGRDHGPFEGLNGIAIMWPFMGPLIDDIGGSPRYASAPFTNPAPWAAHVTDPVLAMIAGGGFDHVNLPVVPGPWMEALAQEPVNETRISYLFGLVDEAVDAILAAGMKVVVKFHATNYILYRPADIIDGLAGPNWTIYRETIRRFARRYRRYPSNLVALSLFNEPEGVVSGWRDYVADMFEVARSEAPWHTLCLSGDNYANIDNWGSSNAGLAGIDPSGYDDRVLWVVHPYLPPVFASQGRADSFYNKYIFGLHWPPNPADKAAAIAAMQAAVDADDSLDAGQKAAKKTSDEGELDLFFDIPLDKWAFNYDFDTKLDAWCDANSIPPDRVYCEEYGVTRTNADWTGAATADRLAYLADMRERIDAHGYRKALFALDAIDYGVTDGEGSDIGEFIEGLLG